MVFKYHERDLRGQTKTGWLDGRHTFSFGDFRDPNRMGFRSLRVINEDHIIPGAGFPTHPHSDMEIITYIVNGALEHKDSMGNGSIIKAGEVQKMSAGTGITHSEFNHSNDNPCHLLQIWIKPSEPGIKPNYSQIMPDAVAAKDSFVLVGSPEGGDNIVPIHQDAKLYLARPAEGETLRYGFEKNRYGFLQLVRGLVEVEGQALKEGDGLEIAEVTDLSIKALAKSELLLFDLA